MIYGQKLHIAFFLLILLWSGCTNKNPEQKKTINAEIRVSDFTGKELKFEKSPERAVCLIESALSGLYMLGMQDHVIAVPGDVYKDQAFQYYSRLDKRIAEMSLPAPGNWDFVSIEQVLGLKADLVIIWSSQSEVAANLEQFGIPVYSVMINNFGDVYKEIEDFGKIFGCSQRADSLINYTRNNLDKAKSLAENDRPVSVYFMWAQGINETSGQNSTVEELLSFAGTRNVCDLNQEHVTISLEKLIEWNPGMIIMWYNDKLDPQDIMQDPVLQGLDAVRNAKVFELPDKFTCDFWTLKMQYPVQQISTWAYPEKSGNLNSDQSFEDLCRYLYKIEIKPGE
jgi:iron complex transport system substrate-binding protein